MKNTSNALRRVMSVVLVFAMMFTSMPTVSAGGRAGCV